MLDLKCIQIPNFELDVHNFHIALQLFLIVFVLLLFQYSWKQNWMAFLSVNLFTQGLLAIASSVYAIQSGPNMFSYLIFFLPAELFILIAEAYLYAGRGMLKGHSKKRAAAYAVTANLISAILGYYLAEAVWRLVVSIL